MPSFLGRILIDQVCLKISDTLIYFAFREIPKAQFKGRLRVKIRCGDGRAQMAAVRGKQN